MLSNKKRQDKTLYYTPHAQWLTANADRIQDLVTHNRWGFTARVYSRQFISQSVWRELEETGTCRPTAAAERSAVLTYRRYGDVLSPAPAVIVKQAANTKLAITEGRRLRKNLETKSVLLQLPEDALDKLWVYYERSGSTKGFPLFLQHVFADCITLMRKFKMPFWPCAVTVNPDTKLEPFVEIRNCRGNPQGLISTGFTLKTLFAFLRQGKDANTLALLMANWWLNMMADGSLFMLQYGDYLDNTHKQTRSLYQCPPHTKCALQQPTQSSNPS